MDAAIKMSYSVERATKVGVYPMREGKPDPAKRLLTESYSLYQLKGGKSQWDGTTLRVKGMVAAQSDFPSSTCCWRRGPRWMTPAVTR